MSREEDLDRLVSRARDGDEEAFGELVTRFGAAVRGMCLLRAADPARADDIAQQVFVTAWQQIGQLGPNALFWPWVEAIARNHLCNEWRRVQREKKLKQRYSVAWLAEAEQKDEEPEDAERLSRQLECLQRCIETLPDNLRRLVRLRYEENASSQKISEELGRSADAVRQTLVRVREKLRDCIEQRMAERGGA